jgi:hypothetical protein
MFEPQLFGLLAQDYLRAAETLFAPTLGFLFLYLLRLPLKQLPLIAAAADYKPPTWLLPIFALGTFFVFSLSLSIGASLSISREQIPNGAFIGSFHRIRDFDVKNDVNGDLMSVELALDQYDGVSDFRLFVNGYRVFGSSSNCMLQFQCKNKDDPTATSLLQSFKQTRSPGNSFLHVFQRYDLPHLEDISHFLIGGGNVIDIHSSNTGVGDCNLTTRLILRYSTGAMRQYQIVIHSRGGAVSPVRGPLLEMEEFYAGGISSVQDHSDETVQINPYRTPKTRGHYRICERIRIQLALTNEAVASLYSDASWQDWARSRVRRTRCELVSGPDVTC